MRLYDQVSKLRQVRMSCCCSSREVAVVDMEDTVSSTAEGQSTESPKDCAAHSPHWLSLEGVNGSVWPSRLMMDSSMVFFSKKDRAFRRIRGQYQSRSKKGSVGMKNTI